MFSDSNYTFYNTNRVEDDATTKSQKEMQNGRFSNYNTTNYFSDNSGESQIQFATEQPAVVRNSIGRTIRRPRRSLVHREC